MQVTLIGCPFKTSYGIASDSLKKALEKKPGTTVEWVASNCGCSDDYEVNRQFQMPRENYKYFDMFTFSDVPSKQAWKRAAKVVAGTIFFRLRAQKYGTLSAGADVVNFQQTLNSHGSTVLFHWLNQRSQFARVITVHELDRCQLANHESNKTYNKADAIIVQHGTMKDKLVSLGVDADKIEIVLHGTALPPLDEHQAREGIIFYGGHHPFSGKGLHAMLKAMTLLKARMGAAAPKLKMSGYFGCDDVAAVNELIAQMGLQNDIIWLNQISMPEFISQYRSSLVCVLPYMGSSAGLAAATSAAVGLPVIGTKNAGNIEHLGDDGIWIKDDNAEEIAAQVEKLLPCDDFRRDLGKRLRQRAERHMSWDVVADSTLAVYERALQRKRDAG